MNLDKLFRMDGVVAVGRFGDGGKLAEFRTKFGRATEIMEFSGLASALFNAVSPVLERADQRRFAPLHGWVYASGEWVSVVNADRVVYASMDKADISGLVRAMSLLSATEGSGLSAAAERKPLAV